MVVERNDVREVSGDEEGRGGRSGGERGVKKGEREETDSSGALCALG
jgi:hypothetical protein